MGLWQQALKLLYEVEDLQGVANCLQALADVERCQEHAAHAVRLIAAAASLRHPLGLSPATNVVATLEEGMSALRLQIGVDAFEAEWAEGSTFGVERAVQFAAELAVSH